MYYVCIVGTVYTPRDHTSGQVQDPYTILYILLFIEGWGREAPAGSHAQAHRGSQRDQQAQDRG